MGSSCPLQAGRQSGKEGELTLHLILYDYSIELQSVNDDKKVNKRKNAMNPGIYYSIKTNEGYPYFRK